MNLYHQPTRYKIALGLAILDVILILITLLRHAYALQEAMVLPLTQAWKQSELWAVLAEMLFYCAILVALYGLISLWLSELRIILWIGVGLVFMAGLVYLLSAVVYYQSEGMGAPIQQGLFMFLFSICSPFLAFKLIKRIRHKAESNIQSPNFPAPY
jgi:hypothetical protein